MLRAAVAARDATQSHGGVAKQLRLVAVALLTSIDEQDLRDVGIDLSTLELAGMRAAAAAQSGVDGIVCAVVEAPLIRACVPQHFILVCPGVRPAGSSAFDQRRIATPKQAVEAGATFIVVGRPISQAADPAAAAQSILDEIAAAERLRTRG